ncbi:MAG: hypothetical protein IJ460_04180 [Clostridia bacterium]|nr:hypothetical protein [Clostridia bacterium]
MKKSKMFLSLIVTAFVLMTPVISLADTEDNTIIYSTSAEGALPANYSGTASGIISIKNPSTLVSATTTKSYVISAVAQSGTAVTLYSYNSGTDKYEKMVSESGEIMQSTVGASGLYAQSVNLNAGKNNIMVVASNTSGTEVIKMEITLNLGFVDKIKSFGVGISQIFG